MKRREFVGLIGGALAAPAYRRRDDVFVERWSWAMGQAVHVMVFAPSEQEGLDACAAALAELRRVESRLSLFDDASDLCELNRHAGRGPMHVDRDLGAVLQRAVAFRELTGGAFDAAVGPLMRAWGLGTPTPGELAAAREAVATAEVRLDGPAARLPNAHTRLDFGGIGVGYGIDRAVAVFQARGIRRAFVDVSGDCAAVGAPPGQAGWLVGIADPDRGGATVAAVRLRDAALATSANTVRRHVMDPRTGRPADALRQASVVARGATAADALSTAMFVSGRRPPGVLWAYGV
ncbi:MAG TPA: FAD:protein FMN transferase [Gemmatimonadales bacterium]|jgi:thiamine biosynthesis lipoprotein|nr:FAD:protein FMN transferase [Gemmatimonadales bacterium]